MRVKLVSFDWDGTLTIMPTKYSWTLINEYLNFKDEAKKSAYDYRSGKIDFVTWCKICVGKYKSLGLTKDKLNELVDKNVKLHQGAIETVNYLRQNRVKVCLISGGIYNMYEQISNKFKLKFDFVSFSTKLNFNKSGQLIDGSYNNYDYDANGKFKILKSFCKNAKVPLKEALHVGDADNDINIFKKCSGVAFASDSEELKRNAKFVIQGNDMRELLKYIS